jgi:hemoglobin
MLRLMALSPRIDRSVGNCCWSILHTRLPINGANLSASKGERHGEIGFDVLNKTERFSNAGIDRGPIGTGGKIVCGRPGCLRKKSLYERLGGVFVIAAVVDRFSDALVKNLIVGQTSQNPQLREWHTKSLERLPGLKFMRTLWVCNVSGGPFKYTATRPGKTPLGLEEAHRNLKISPAEFDEVAAELGRTLDYFKVPKPEKSEVLAAFAAHKDEVTAGYTAHAKPG